MLRIKGRTLPPVPALEPFTLSEAVRGAVRIPHHDAHRREGTHSIVRAGAGANRAECAPLAGECRSSRTALVRTMMRTGDTAAARRICSGASWAFGDVVSVTHSYLLVGRVRAGPADRPTVRVWACGQRPCFGAGRGP
ncbi:hypothetical protein [Streptomyces javensis]|uniref:Uncharacterized protein n=1 Tax=Streptomyces javensis TaxID=114698 RepID=A0ABS0RAI3_9ACTN|nr:hypothetical protein [Streptomyces javensis]MBI0314095.1 hypothetical protein [Streptomyces javensis]